MCGVKAEALASRKVVSREANTEGNETAKSGTDEQKRHTRLVYSGKQPISCNAPSELRKGWYMSQRLDEGKSSYRGRSLDTRDVWGEVSRGHSSRRNEPTGRKKILKEGGLTTDEGLNVRMFQM